MSISRARAVAFALLLSATTLFAATRDATPFSGAGVRVQQGFDGRVFDAFGLSSVAGNSREASARELFASQAKRLFGGSPADLRPEFERESLLGSHLFFRLYANGIPVENGGVAVSFDSAGNLTSIHNRTGSVRAIPSVIESGSIAACRALELSGLIGATVTGTALVGWLDDDGSVIYLQRVEVALNGRRWHVYLDPVSGELHHASPLFFTVTGRVFQPDPVTTLNQPALRDNDDSAAAVPSSAYRDVDLPGLSDLPTLSGPNVTIVDIEIPNTTRANPATGLVFDRSFDEFEEVNAYYHLDNSQRYLRSLGFDGAKAIVDYSIEVDAHGEGGADNSSYRFLSPGHGRLFFGDGGVDDAEDADIVLHEYGHAIQDSIVPGGFDGAAASESRALGEGFGDYWAFSGNYGFSVASGRDPYCLGDWDARCGEGPSTRCGYDAGADCLRRVDGTKTMDDFHRTGSSGTEHSNGEIWSSALREIFVASVQQRGIEQGRRLADRTILEAQFGLPPAPSYKSAALRLVETDRRLNAGAMTSVICGAMISRRILNDSDCAPVFRGDLTLIQSPSREIAIPDNRPEGITSLLHIGDTRVAQSLYVKIDIRHPRRGDLRLTLRAPDGTEAVIQTESGDSAANISATYGLDAEPSQPLSVFEGKIVAGDWTLRVSDNFGVDEGVLVSWSLIIRFAGDSQIQAREKTSAPTLHLPVSGNAAGAEGTQFVSDVRLFNGGAANAAVTIFFTPSGDDGSTSFSAINAEIPPGAIVALDDIIGSWFRTSGLGSIEIRGDVGSLAVTSRVYNTRTDGTYGQFFRASARSAAAGAGDSQLNVVQLRNTADFRSNAGVAEVAGGSGEAEIVLYDVSGGELARQTVLLKPYGHSQVSLLGGVGGTNAPAFRAAIRVLSGDAGIIAYGSVVDNVSGDAVFVPGAKIGTGGTRLVVPAAMRGDGGNGTKWRSDLFLFNGSSETKSLTLTYHQGDAAIAPRTAPVTLDAGHSLLLEDVVKGTFLLDASSGQVTADGDSVASWLVTSRAWTPGAAGSFGQFVPSMQPERAIGLGDGERSLSHVDSSAAFRANAGVTEVTGQRATVRVRVRDAAGTEIRTFDVPVEPYGNVQTSLLLAGTPSMSNGRVSFEVVSGSGRIVSYVSVIDNLTGDPFFVPQ